MMVLMMKMVMMTTIIMIMAMMMMMMMTMVIFSRFNLEVLPRLASSRFQNSAVYFYR